MDFTKKEPPRKFIVNNDIEISDCGTLELNTNEQITFVFSEEKKEHDFTCKEWGFYATPSINGRLKKQGFKTALVKNEKKQIFLMVVDSSKIDLFNDYILREKQTVIEWLDEFYEEDK